MTEYAPQSIQKLFNDIKAGIPAALMGGIIGDKAHTYGYHRGRNYVSGSDYSVQLAADKKGNGEAASALDISWSAAQPQYDVSKRLLNAKNDARCKKVLRSFFGSTDGKVVCGWDYQGGYAVSSDSSHLWHVHLSILRQYADDYNSLAPVADVIIGKSTTPPKEDDVPQRLQIQRNEDVKIKGGQVTELKFNVENADTGNIFYGKNKPSADQKGAWINTGGAGACSYVSTFSLNIADLPNGKSVLTGLAWCDQNGKTTGSGPLQEHVSNGSTTPIVDTRNGHSGKGKGLKVRIKPEVDCTVKAGAMWYVLYWRD